MRRMIKKILLIYPPVTWPIDKEFEGIQEPLGILYIASFLRKAGLNVSVLNFSAFDKVRKRHHYMTYGADPLNIKNMLRKFTPDLIGVSCPTGANEFDLFETCKIIKSIHQNTPIVVGGVHPSMMPQRILSQRAIDYVILGEGEYRLKKLIDVLNNKSSFSQFDGIAYRQSGKIIVNQSTHVIEDIDSLPFPARDLVDMKIYSYINKKYQSHPPYFHGLVEATRGCFNSCYYCAVSKFEGKKIRYRSVQNIISEISLLKKYYGVEDISFVQNNIALNKRYLKDLCSELTKIQIRPAIIAGIWPNILDRDIIKAMANAGFTSIILALSSASKRVLREIMHRPVNIDRIPELVKECRKQGLLVKASFVLGMIGETKRELLESLNYPIKLKLDAAEYNVAFPLPGTNLYDLAKNKGYLPKKFNYFKEIFSETSVLQIPSDSPDFAVSPEQLKELIMQKQIFLRSRFLKKMKTAQF